MFEAIVYSNSQDFIGRFYCYRHLNLPLLLFQLLKLIKHEC